MSCSIPECRSRPGRRGRLDRQLVMQRFDALRDERLNRAIENLRGAQRGPGVDRGEQHEHDRDDRGRHGRAGEEPCRRANPRRSRNVVAPRRCPTDARPRRQRAPPGWGALRSADICGPNSPTPARASANGAARTARAHMSDLRRWRFAIGGGLKTCIVKTVRHWHLM